LVVGFVVVGSTFAGVCVLATAWGTERELVADRFGLVEGGAIGSGSATDPRARRLGNFDAGTLGANCCPLSWASFGIGSVGEENRPFRIAEGPANKPPLVRPRALSAKGNPRGIILFEIFFFDLA
jgi:hypothetical protein